MHFRRIPSLFFCCLVLFTLVDCASTVQGAASGGSTPDFLSLSLMTAKETRSLYGFDASVNPFLFPSSFLLPKSTDYLVLKLVLNTKAPADLDLQQVTATDEKGKLRASAFDRAAFTEEAALLSSQIQNQTPRQNTIRWNYLPAFTTRVDPGMHAYVLVLGGKHPLPDSTTLHVSLTLNGQPQSIDIPVTEEYVR